MGLAAIMSKRWANVLRTWRQLLRGRDWQRGRHAAELGDTLSLLRPPPGRQPEGWWWSSGHFFLHWSCLPPSPEWGYLLIPEFFLVFLHLSLAGPIARHHGTDRWLIKYHPKVDLKNFWNNDKHNRYTEPGKIIAKQSVVAWLGCRNWGAFSEDKALLSQF